CRRPRAARVLPDMRGRDGPGRSGEPAPGIRRPTGPGPEGWRQGRPDRRRLRRPPGAGRYRPVQRVLGPADDHRLRRADPAPRARARRGGAKPALIGGVPAVPRARGVTGQSTGFWDPPMTTGSEERTQPRGPVTIEAEALHQAYADDPRAAAERFDNREMVVSGEFLRIVPDGYGSLDLRLKTSNPDEQLGIDVAQLAIEDAKQLRPGQRVTVSCQQMGAGGDELWVQDCAIQLAGEVAVPATAIAPDAGEQEE